MEALQVENDHLSREIAILRETVKVNKEKPSIITLELFKVELTCLPHPITLKNNECTFFIDLIAYFFQKN